MSVTILVLLVLGLIVVGLLLYFVTLYNGLVRLKNDINKAWSNIDVLLKQRHDEIPKLIESCKSYLQYEQKTFQAITDARSAYQRATTFEGKAQADRMLTDALKTLFAVAENYPELKANGNFMQLQGRITDIEERVADRCEFFNDEVNTYNIRIQQFPDIFVAQMLKLQQRTLFKVPESKRADLEFA